MDHEAIQAILVAHGFEIAAVAGAALVGWLLARRVSAALRGALDDAEAQAARQRERDEDPDEDDARAPEDAPAPPVDRDADPLPAAGPDARPVLRVLARWAPGVIVLAAVAVAVEATGLLEVSWVLVGLRDAADFELFHLADHAVTPTTVLTLVAVVALGLYGSRLLQRTAGRTLGARGTDAGSIAALQRLMHYAVMLVAIAVGLDAAGFDLSTLFAASAVFAVGISFGLQNIVKNFVSGIILLIEQSIKPGDILTVGGQLVRVKELGTRATIALSLEDDSVIIPNSLLIENTVVNHSLRDEAVRARMKVGVAYSSDLRQVQRVLDRTARTFAGRVPHRDPIVLLTDFGSSSVDFDVSIWVDHAFVRPRVLSDLRHAVWNALAEAGIVIAFPQLDVHFDPGVAPPAEGQADPK